MEVDKNIYPAVGFNFRVTSSDANFGLIPASVLTGFELKKYMENLDQIIVKLSYQSQSHTEI